MEEKRKITIFVRTIRSDRPERIDGFIDKYTLLVETKGFFVYFDKYDFIHIIPSENVEYFAISYTLSEYALSEGFIDGSKKPDNMFMSNYSIDTGKKDCTDINDCFSVTKDFKYVIFDIFSNDYINRIFIPINIIKDISVSTYEDDNAFRYKATLLFDKELLNKVSSDVKDKVLDLFDNLSTAYISKDEVIELYLNGFYDTEKIPEDLLNGLNLYINQIIETDQETEIDSDSDKEYLESVEIIEEDNNENDDVVEEDEKESSDDNITVIDEIVNDHNEENKIIESLKESKPELLKEVEDEVQRSIGKLKLYSKKKFIERLNEDNDKRNESPEFNSVLLDIEDEYFNLIKRFDNTISKDSDDFKSALYDYIKVM